MKVVTKTFSYAKQNRAKTKFFLTLLQYFCSDNVKKVAVVIVDDDDDHDGVLLTIVVVVVIAVVALLDDVVVLVVNAFDTAAIYQVVILVPGAFGNLPLNFQLILYTFGPKETCYLDCSQRSFSYVPR